MSFIDNETKKLFLTLGGACLFLVGLLWLSANAKILVDVSNKVSNNLVSGTKTFNKEYGYNLLSNKTYFLNVKTNLGDMTFMLYKENNPITTNNVVNLVRDDFYKTVTGIDKTNDYLLFSKTNLTSYFIKEEINAYSLDLDKIKVSDYINVLKDIYPESDLRDNASKTLKDYYESKGYSYKMDINSKFIKKGSLVLYSELPGKFNSPFFISTQPGLPKIDGRMTNFGEITAGQDVLDKLSQADQNSISIQSITIEEK
jgi:cyclophilin family peptidyl-prolyl cis-trans isomerase